MNYKNNRRELTPKEKFERMVQGFLKVSDERQKDLKKYQEKLIKKRKRKVKNDDRSDKY